MLGGVIGKNEHRTDTALHAHRKENVFGKLIFSFQGSERENGMAVFCGTAIRIIGAAILPKKVPFTIHDIFRRFINGVKTFVYRLFTFDALMGWKFRI